MTEVNPDPIPTPVVAAAPADPGGFAQDQRVYLFLIASAFLITAAALLFMALVDAPVTELAMLLLGLGALSALLTAAATFSAWRLARLAQPAGSARAKLLRASELRLAFAIGALLLAFICATLGCGVTLELKGFAQDAGSEQDQAAMWRRT
ncbi:MAG: hypothetical protein ABSE43_00065 [Steroidobacteraceae bacterium]